MKKLSEDNIDFLNLEIERILGSVHWIRQYQDNWCTKDKFIQAIKNLEDTCLEIKHKFSFPKTTIK